MIVSCTYIGVLVVVLFHRADTIPGKERCVRNGHFVPVLVQNKLYSLAKKGFYYCIEITIKKAFAFYFLGV